MILPPKLNYMRFLMFVIAFLIVTVSASGQTGRDIFYNEVNYFLDEKGDTLTQTEFEKLLKEANPSYHKWEKIEIDSTRISRLIPKKEAFNVSYPKIYNALEEITQSKFQGNPLIIIHYNFVDDLCSPASGYNYWDTLRVRRNQRFSDNLSRRIENEFPNVIALHFFEPGINIEPSQILKQYFYLDLSRFFRTTIFKNPSSCGSVAIIRPGGRTVVFNGETSIPVIAESLQQ